MRCSRLGSKANYSAALSTAGSSRCPKTSFEPFDPSSRRRPDARQQKAWGRPPRLILPGESGFDFANFVGEPNRIGASPGNVRNGQFFPLFPRLAIESLLIGNFELQLQANDGYERNRDAYGDSEQRGLLHLAVRVNVFAGAEWASGNPWLTPSGCGPSALCSAIGENSAIRARFLVQRQQAAGFVHAVGGDFPTSAFLCENPCVLCVKNTA